MTVHYWLRTATQFLQSKAITTARLDCLVLLEDTLRVDRARLLAEPDTEMSEAQVAHLQKLLIRRAGHEPLAYIRGRSEFYGRTFVIKPAVLTPRPESEAIIEVLKGLVADGRLPVKGADFIQIADVGAGSGALGITAALELPQSRVELLEIDKKAAAIAQINVDLFTLNCPVLISDLLEGSQQANDVLLCNLPYVPDDHVINKAAGHEPALALFGGPDGLDLYRKLFAQLKNSQKKVLFILTEALPAQHHDLAALAAASGYLLKQTEGFCQLFELIETMPKKVKN